MNTKQTNIIFLLHLPPPVHGSTLVGELIKKSSAINNKIQGRYINLLLSKKVDDSGKIKTLKSFRFVKIWIHLLGKLIHRKPDLCYFALTTTGPGLKKDALLVLLLRIFKVRTLYHIHNKGVVKEKNNWLNSKIYNFVFKNQKVILLSEHLYYDVQDFVNNEDVYYCPNGIKDYQSKTEHLKSLEIRPFKILFFSNLIAEKGVFVLIDACSILKERGINFICDFIGGEADVSELEFNQYVEQKGLSEQVRYHGKRYGKLKEMTFENADVFVLPSRYDCFPLVVLEAMQHKLPVITAKEGGMPDMVEDGFNGFLIDRYDDEEELANKLELLFHDPELRKQMGDNGRTKYINNFTIGIFENRLLSILNEVINKKQ